MSSAPHYHKVPAEGDSEKGETVRFLSETQQDIESHQRQQQVYRSSNRGFPILLSIAAFCLGSLSTATIGYFQSGIHATSYGLYEKGWIEEKLSKWSKHLQCPAVVEREKCQRLTSDFAT